MATRSLYHFDATSVPIPCQGLLIEEVGDVVVIYEPTSKERPCVEQRGGQCFGIVRWEDLGRRDHVRELAESRTESDDALESSVLNILEQFVEERSYLYPSKSCAMGPTRSSTRLPGIAARIQTNDPVFERYLGRLFDSSFPVSLLDRQIFCKAAMVENRWAQDCRYEQAVALRNSRRFGSPYDVKQVLA